MEEAANNSTNQSSLSEIKNNSTFQLMESMNCVKLMELIDIITVIKGIWLWNCSIFGKLVNLWINLRKRRAMNKSNSLAALSSIKSFLFSLRMRKEIWFDWKKRKCGPKGMNEWTNQINEVDLVKWAVSFLRQPTQLHSITINQTSSIIDEFELISWLKWRRMVVLGLLSCCRRRLWAVAPPWLRRREDKPSQTTQPNSNSFLINSTN